MAEEHVSQTPITVRYCETDQMGVVHHSRYYSWFECGRTDFIKLAGITYTQLENEGVLIPLVQSAAKYIEGAKYEDEIVIKTRLISLGVARCTFFYEAVRTADNKLLAIGRTVHAFVGRNFKPINLKKKQPEFYERLSALVCSENSIKGQLL